MQLDISKTTYPMLKHSEYDFIGAFLWVGWFKTALFREGKLLNYEGRDMCKRTLDYNFVLMFFTSLWQAIGCT